MPDSALDMLYAQYQAVLDQMEDEFSTHAFILRLAQQHQATYIDALYAYRLTDAPFRTLHALLSRHLHAYGDRGVLEYHGQVPSHDILSGESECAMWRKVSAN
jgi:hypothetical protein